MSKHTVTEHWVQIGADERHGTFVCSCGLSYEADMRKETRRTALAALEELHKAPKKESTPTPKAKKRQAKKENKEEIVSDLVEEPQDEPEETWEDEGGA